MLKTWMKRGVPVCLALAFGGFAQETTPLKLTLKDAVNLALKQNPQVILANLEVSQSQQDRLVARSALLPQANGNVSETVNRLNLHAAIGLSFPAFPPTSGRSKCFKPELASTGRSSISPCGITTELPKWASRPAARRKPLRAKKA